MSQLAHTHPRGATEIVDAAFQFYRARLGDLLVLCALLLVPAALLAAITPSPVSYVFQFVQNLMFLVCQGAIAVMVAAALEQDRALSAGDTLRGLGNRSGSVVAVSIMAGILIMLGFLLLVIPGIVVAVWTAVAVPVAAIEGRRNSDALGRSRELVRGQFWHVFGTSALAWVIVMLIVMGLAFTSGLLLAMVGVPDKLRELVGALLIVPLFPLAGVTTAFLYFDLRVRNEGADVEALARDLASAPSV